MTFYREQQNKENRSIIVTKEQKKSRQNIVQGWKERGK